MPYKNKKQQQEHQKKYYKEYYAKNKDIILKRMKKYNKIYQEKHKEYYKEYRKKHYIPHPTQLKYNGVDYQKNYAREIRLKVLEKLGNKCCKCGFNDKRALQIDHINGGGTKERKQKSNGRSYNYNVMLSVDKNENKYQLLCANCNWIKKVENKELGNYISLTK